MPEQVYPILFALFLWWFSTGAIIFLDGLPRGTYRWSLAGATIAGILGLIGIGWNATTTELTSIYCGFTCALLVWAWCEITFLMGVITGPRRAPCPSGISTRQRFWLSVEVLAHHEIALMLSGLAIAAITWNAANKIALETFALLWLMRLSTKLNIFLGVPNVAAELLPPHLHYLKTYFRVSAMNRLFPFSLVLASAACAMLVGRAVASGGSNIDNASASLLATLAALGVLEHVLLVVPFSSSTLWGWSMVGHGAAAVPQANSRERGASKAPTPLP